MKVYNLCCEQEHHFEGWFSSEEDFRRQLEQKRIQCPLCDSVAITRRPSAPRLNLAASQAPKSGTLAQFQARVAALMREVIAATEDVGERFAEEARRIHYDEAPERPIRGVATLAQYEELADEGIEVALLPLPAPKESLQ